MAEQYQLFPDLSESEYLELKADIDDRGVQVPVEYDEAGNILDGHHRVRACEELGIKDFPSLVRYGMSEEEKRHHVRKLNLARRHLTREQRDKVIQDMKAEGLSTRAIAEVVGVHHSTVADATRGVGNPTPATVTGRDGKQYPAKKKKREPQKPSLFTTSESQRETATTPQVAEKVTTGKYKSVEAASKAAHVSQNTGIPEWYTPDEYLDAARAVLGTIDLDPASSKIAQKRVKAKRFYTVADDGLSKKWKGRVWMNPPYTSGLVNQFMAKLCEHYEKESVSEAIVLVNNATDAGWFQDACKLSSAVCFPRGRIKFLDEDGNPGAPLQGQALLYFGNKDGAFVEEFMGFGICARIGHDYV